MQVQLNFQNLGGANIFEGGGWGGGTNPAGNYVTLNGSYGKIFWNKIKCKLGKYKMA